MTDTLATMLDTADDTTTDQAAPTTAKAATRITGKEAADLVAKAIDGTASVRVKAYAATAEEAAAGLSDGRSTDKAPHGSVWCVVGPVDVLVPAEAAGAVLLLTSKGERVCRKLEGLRGEPFAAWWTLDKAPATSHQVAAFYCRVVAMPRDAATKVGTWTTTDPAKRDADKAERARSLIDTLSADDRARLVAMLAGDDDKAPAKAPASRGRQVKSQSAPRA